MVSPVSVTGSVNTLVLEVLPGCEISTGPRTNASGILVGPVENLVYF